MFVSKLVWLLAAVLFLFPHRALFEGFSFQQCDESLTLLHTFFINGQSAAFYSTAPNCVLFLYLSTNETQSICPSSFPIGETSILTNTTLSIQVPDHGTSGMTYFYEFSLSTRRWIFQHTSQCDFMEVRDDYTPTAVLDTDSSSVTAPQYVLTGNSFPVSVRPIDAAGSIIPDLVIQVTVDDSDGTTVATDSVPYGDSGLEGGYITSFTLNTIGTYTIAASIDGVSWSTTLAITADTAQTELLQPAGSLSYLGRSVASTDQWMVASQAESVTIGIAFVYQWVDGYWLEHSRLDMPDDLYHLYYPEFGASVAISEDHIAVGAPKTYIYGNGRSGVVFTYLYNATKDMWLYESVISNPNYDIDIDITNDNENGLFGDSVVLDGTLLVVADKYYISGFTYDGCSWGSPTMLLTSGLNISSSQLSISYPWMALGTPNTDSTGITALFDVSSDDWMSSYPLVIQSPNPQEDAAFGSSVSVSCEGDTQRLLIGEPGATVDGIASAGLAYLYEYTDDAWALMQTLRPDDPGKGSSYGQDVTQSVISDLLVIDSDVEVEMYYSTDGYISSELLHVFDSSASVYSMAMTSTSLLLGVRRPGTDKTECGVYVNTFLPTLYMTINATHIYGKADIDLNSHNIDNSPFNLTFQWNDPTCHPVSAEYSEHDESYTFLLPFPDVVPSTLHVRIQGVTVDSYTFTDRGLQVFDAQSSLPSNSFWFHLMPSEPHNFLGDVMLNREESDDYPSIAASQTVSIQAGMVTLVSHSPTFPLGLTGDIRIYFDDSYIDYSSGFTAIAVADSAQLAIQGPSWDVSGSVLLGLDSLLSAASLSLHGTALEGYGRCEASSLLNITDLTVSAGASLTLSADSLTVGGSVMGFSTLSLEAESSLLVMCGSVVYLDTITTYDADIVIQGSVQATNGALSGQSLQLLDGAYYSSDYSSDSTDIVISSSTLSVDEISGPVCLNDTHLHISEGASLSTFSMSCSPTDSIVIEGSLEIQTLYGGISALLNAPNVQITSSGNIDIIGPNSDDGYIPGEEENLHGMGGGAAHIGGGSNPDGTMNEDTYSISESLLGSGGGGAGLGLGGSGGGAVTIDASFIQLDGSITAVGSPGSCSSYLGTDMCGGGGSGGTIQLGGVISGGGHLFVTGGDAVISSAGDTSVGGGAGGGGMVVITEGSLDGADIHIHLDGGSGADWVISGEAGSQQLPDNLCNGIYSLKPNSLSCQLSLWFRILLVVALLAAVAGAVYLFRRCRANPIYDPRLIRGANFTSMDIRDALRLGKETEEKFADFRSHLLHLNLDELKIVEPLGSGSSAEVFSGTLSNAPVCIKKINVDLRRSITRRNIIRECLILSQIQHDHVLRLFGIRFSEREVLIVTELASNGSLLDMRRKYFRRYSKPSAAYVQLICRLFSQVATVLDHLHHHQPPIVHRDLKPANILLRNRETAVLADFGISRAVESFDATQTATVAGSPAYMSPEMVSGRLSTSSDVYCIGVCLYEMATNSKPYNGATNVLRIINLLTKGIKPSTLEEPLWQQYTSLRNLIHTTWRSHRARPTMRQVALQLEAIAKGLRVK
eukprot:gnl/Dysnectes_brevis/4022_a5249_609.p1 GENE.gnl/Dysnectes_brevis/4022_a5249_609~~gnl/Dysnectes_brevis/4022_a5249_609.p1  ORF type:complete len:1562 (-),score=343.68 gnl/Dysnectes_brevis/4022_a5249_609:958-5643(-)